MSKLTPIIKPTDKSTFHALRKWLKPIFKMHPCVLNLCSVFWLSSSNYCQLYCTYPLIELLYSHKNQDLRLYFGLSSNCHRFLGRQEYSREVISENDVVDESQLTNRWWVMDVFIKLGLQNGRHKRESFLGNFIVWKYFLGNHFVALLDTKFIVLDIAVCCVPVIGIAQSGLLFEMQGKS